MTPTPMFDLFRVERKGDSPTELLRWQGTAESLEAAQLKIKSLPTGDYIIFNQQTGEQTVMECIKAAQ